MQLIHKQSPYINDAELLHKDFDYFKKTVKRGFHTSHTQNQRYLGIAVSTENMV